MNIVFPPWPRTARPAPLIRASVTVVFAARAVNNAAYDLVVAPPGTYVESMAHMPSEGAKVMALAKDVFFGAELKVEWAYKHIDELNQRIATFEASDFYGTVVERDAETGKDTIRLVLTKPLPLELPLVIGDAVHNLRAAFDFVWNVLIHSIEPGDTRQGFPFHADRQGVQAAIANAAKGAVKAKFPGVEELILDEFQPYLKGIGEDFNALNHLDRADKHRLLILTERLTKFHGVKLTDHFENVFNIEMTTKGDEINLYRGPAFMNTQVEHNTKPILEVLFAEPGFFQGRPVVSSLQNVAHRTREVVNAFKERFAG